MTRVIAGSLDACQRNKKMGRAYWLGEIGPKDYFELPYNDIMIEGKTKYGTWITMSEISWRDHGLVALELVTARNIRSRRTAVG